MNFRTKQSFVTENFNFSAILFSIVEILLYIGIIVIAPKSQN
jgi:hypothetical protein